jgi:phage terminase large subunit-like protein
MSRGRPRLSLRDLAVMLAGLPEDRRRAFIATMAPADILVMDADFETWIHEGQEEPKSEGWRTWLMMAGRGYGKTRAGAEWITALATRSGRPVRIALVGATESEARLVMVEGESGLLAVGRRRGRRPRWEPSLGRLTWPGGSEARIFSGENPDGLRGPQHDFAWCDELAKWHYAEATWDNLQFGLRAGPRPRALVTTTPRPIPLLRRIRAEPWTVETHGRTEDNISNGGHFLAVMAATYGDTRLGRQELGGELIEDVQGALWTRAMVEACRVAGMGTVPSTRMATVPSNGMGTVPFPHDGMGTVPSTGMGTAPFPRGGDNSGDGLRKRDCPLQRNDEIGLSRVVVGVDPPASAAGDACGIVVCGIDGDGIGYVLDDRSVRGLAPEGWAAAVAAAAEAWEADCVIVETNQGGEMVESVLRGVDAALPVRPVKARFGKARRAEPVALRFARGKAKFAGAFPELEDELCGLCAGGAYEGPGRSPDRADAMVWAMAELLLGERREPRVRGL